MQAIKEAREHLKELVKLEKIERDEMRTLDGGQVFVILKGRATKEIKEAVGGIRKDSYYGNIIGSVGSQVMMSDMEQYLRSRIDEDVLKVRVYQT